MSEKPLPLSSPIAIVGAGVSGLTVGCWLAKLGYAVTLWSKPGANSMVSTKAGAVWLPFQAKPKKLVNQLAMETLEDLIAFSRVYPAAGISMPKVAFYFSKGSLAGRLPDHPKLPRKAIPFQGLPAMFEQGYEVVLPFVDTTQFMPFLKALFLELGGAIREQNLGSLNEIPTPFRTVVNCSGLGARELVGDASLFPIRGQTLKVKPWRNDAFYIDDSDENFPAYIFSRATDCLLGGTAQAYQGDAEPNERDTQSILERCARMAPEARDAELLCADVGLRPGREAGLRLHCEPPDRNGRTILHNYGHGGSGFTIGFGCARWVVARIVGRADTAAPLTLPF